MLLLFLIKFLDQSVWVGFNALLLVRKKYNCSGPQTLKVKESDISPTKNYCIQKISSINRFILKIQQILGSHEGPCPTPKHC